MTARPRSVLSLLLVGLTLLTSPARGQEAAEAEATSRDILGVVEFFTSQGCASCVAAESVMAEMAKDRSVLALAYHVDYWDYIGWVDPHGTRANTDRQRAYAKAFGTGTIYTPQAVVNGRSDVVGSRKAAIRAALEKTPLAGDEARATVALVIRGDKLHIDADAPGLRAEGRAPVLMLVTYDDETSTPVDKGENRGTTLVNTHAVRDWRILGLWTGKSMEVDIPMSMLRADDGSRTGCAAILQTVTESGTPGPILAAAAVEF